MSITPSYKAQRFTESVIREMTRQCNKYGGVNLAQGFPDFPCPPEMKEAACKAIMDDINQYSVTWGSATLREAIAEKVTKYNHIPTDPDKNITVCCGSTEAMISSLLAVVNPGDEVILFEPFYENYGPDSILCGASPRFVPTREPDFSFDEAELKRLFNNNTKAIVINTPNNPSGKVFSREELEYIASLCQKWDAVAITDEIYEHILYDGLEHISIASLKGMEDKSITISGASKTYSVTGWRIGYAIACEELTGAIRKVHDFLTVGAPAPLQEAVVAGFKLPQQYYESLQRDYQRRRSILMEGLEEAGFTPYMPKGSYYIMADISHFGFDNDVSFAHYLVKEVGVATVPGSSFYNDPAHGKSKLRFTFCKKDETLKKAVELLMKMKG